MEHPPEESDREDWTEDDVHSPAPVGIPRREPSVRFVPLNQFAAGLVSDVSRTASVIWFMLWTRADRLNRISVTNQQISEWIKADSKTVKRGISELMKAGAIKRTRTGACGIPSDYQL